MPSAVSPSAGRLEERGRLFLSLYGLWTYHLLQSERRPAIDRADELALLAETPVQVFMGSSAQMVVSFWNGRFTQTWGLAGKAAALYEPNTLPELAAFGYQSSLNPHVFGYWVLWILGQPEAAVRKRDAVLATVEALRSPFLLAYALAFDMVSSHWLRDLERGAAMAERLIPIARDQEFAYLLAIGTCGQGWAAYQRGDSAGGIALLQTGLDLMSSTGGRVTMGYHLSCLIEAYLKAGRLEEGLAAARETLSGSETRLDVWFDSELLRLQGELLRAAGDPGSAEASFRKALDTARDQGARAFELRAAISLYRFLLEQGRGDEARPPLAAVYQAYTEGFATPDLTEARQLLEQLA